MVVPTLFGRDGYAISSSTYTNYRLRFHAVFGHGS